MSNPRLDDSRPSTALLGASAGIPITKMAPMTAPVTEPMPPMTTMATRLSESLTKKKLCVKAMLAKAPARSAPPRPASPPASAKAWSFTRAGRTV